ncbi:helix-turn-helix transcriptional regulator [Paenarthrobacter nicotinovorans]|uniref:Helix-turn-helix transcriptional regulator n=1 Tax=Paenarthrobacter nicotinovorans TaxID=29320 RepID=A0ABV0GM45_PAENI
MSAESVWGLQIVKDTTKKPGTVYPILERLELAGWVEGEWEEADGRKGPRRRYYRLIADARPLARAYVGQLQSRLPSVPRPSPALSECAWGPA